MLRNLRSRRRLRYGPHLCVLIAALLLLVSVSLLHTRLSQPHHILRHRKTPQNEAVYTEPLLFDSEDSITSNHDVEDKIDEFDTVEEDQQNENVSNEEEETPDPDQPRVSSSGYFFDHITGSIRRESNKRSIEEWDYDYSSFAVQPNVEDKSKAAFGSDDIPVDDEVRNKLIEVKGIEDALLLKIGKVVSPLRDKWGEWFEKKSEFLRRDKMFRSSFEVLNPMNNILLQDPDVIGATGLTRGDKVVQKWLFSEFKRTPFTGKKPLGIAETNRGANSRKKGKEPLIERSEIKRADRRTLDDNADNVLYSNRVENLLYRVENLKENLDLVQEQSSKNEISNKKVEENSTENLGLSGSENLSNESKGSDDEVQNEFTRHIYADGERWGYYPGLHPGLSFSNFMDEFFSTGKCYMRVYMVWNSPPWMYSVRHQRGLESLLYHHPDACVVVFSETIELDFFKDSFVKKGYKVAVVMPNLDELLENTPTHTFASVWFEWKQTKFYSTHYSELVRLAVLYKYGGIYIDSDVIVLKSLSSLNNSVGLEDVHAGSSLNGAVMAFRKDSPFILDCLKEYYLTYDDTCLRCNGAGLLTRVAIKFRNRENVSVKQLELKVQPSFVFFPLSSKSITRYFANPATELEKARQDSLLKKILDESLTCHFWNSANSALIPESDSLVTRLVNFFCIHCSDVL